MSSSLGWPTLAEPLPPLLARAYRLTLYRAAGYEIRIGQRAPAGLFALTGSSRATLLTAWNPYSRRMPREWNHRMQAQLRRCLRRFKVVDAEGVLGDWREEMLLVGGDSRPVVRLSRRFRQHATVVLRRDQRARLASPQ